MQAVHILSFHYTKIIHFLPFPKSSLTTFIFWGMVKNGTNPPVLAGILFSEAANSDSCYTQIVAGRWKPKSGAKISLQVENKKPRRIAGCPAAPRLYLFVIARPLLCGRGRYGGYFTTTFWPLTVYTPEGREMACEPESVLL